MTDMLRGAHPEPLPVLWVDVETTGLDDERGSLMEVALVVTDPGLNEIASTQRLVMPAEEHLASLSPEMTQMHTDSGLLNLVGTADLLRTVEMDLLTFVVRYFGERKPMLGGSSVHFDRRWLARHMPGLSSRFHHRNVDVSTVKELCRVWRPEVVAVWEEMAGKPRHRAYPDILATLAELRLYRDEVFRPPLAATVDSRLPERDAVVAWLQAKRCSLWADFALDGRRLARAADWFLGEIESLYDSLPPAGEEAA